MHFVDISLGYTVKYYPFRLEMDFQVEKKSKKT